MLLLQQPKKFQNHLYLFCLNISVDVIKQAFNTFSKRQPPPPEAFQYRLKQTKEFIKGHDLYVFYILKYFLTSLTCRSNALLLAISSFSWSGDNRIYSLDLCGLRFIFVYSLPWRLSNNTFKVRGRMPIFSSVPAKRIFVLHSLRVEKSKHPWTPKTPFIPPYAGIKSYVKELGQKWDKLNYSAITLVFTV